MKVRLWLLLILAQMIWASSYTAMKIALTGLPVVMVAFLRYFIVVLFFLPLWLKNGFPKMTKKILLGSALVGILNFYGSPMLQVTALRYTQSMDASFIVLLEPLITMLLAFLILHEKISKNLWKVLSLAILGFFLMSDIHFSSEAFAMSKWRLFGNLLFFGSIFFEGLCSVTGKIFTKVNKPWDAMGLLMFFGFAFYFVIHGREILSYDYLTISSKAWMAIMFLSIGCSIFAYTAWYVAIEKIKVQYVALTLFLQPIIGSILGKIFFDEQLSLRACLGAAIIVMSLIWWQQMESIKKAQLRKLQPVLPTE